MRATPVNMKERKNIDRLFQEGFKDFESAPPANAWDSIESQLDQATKRPVAIPLWWRLAGVAAIAVVILSVLFYNDGNKVPVELKDPIVEEYSSPAVEDQESKEITQQNESSPTGSNNSIDNAVVDNDDMGSHKQRAKTKYNTTNNSGVASINQVKENTKNATSKLANTNPSRLVNASQKEPTSNNSRLTAVNDGISRDNKDPKRFSLLGKPMDSTTADSSISPLNSGIAAGAVDSSATANKIAIEDAIAASTVNNESLVDSTRLKRWSAATVIAPVYASSFTGSSVNDQVSPSNQNAQTDLSYGLALTYNLNSRWSVRTGVHQVNMNYVNDNVDYGFNASNFSFDDSQATATYQASAVSTSRAAGAPFSGINSFDQELQRAAVLSSFKGDLNQQLGYLEVPLEVKYRILDKKLGISVLGGFSALFLTDNQVSIENNGRRLELGTDDNFQDFNQSANFGLGLDYQFNNNIGLSIEPTFKYQLNALRNDIANFRPYTIGVYTGLMYRF